MPDYRVTVIGPGVSHTFLLDGGPLENPENFQSALFTIGFITAAWARLEQQIDMIIIQVNKAQHSTETRELYDPEHPASFSRKIKVLKKYFNQHPALKAHKAAMQDFTPKLKKLSQHRNACVHAILEAYDSATDTIKLNSIKFEGNDTFTATDRTLAISTIQALAVNINQANRFLTTISAALFNPDALEQLGKR